MMPVPPDCAYRAIRPLGQGGVGSVCLGERRHDKRRVALKHIPPQPGVSAGLREFSMAMTLRHPHIVQCLDFLYLGQQGSILVYEWMPGGSLRDLLNLGYRPSRGWATRCLTELLQALDYLEGQGQVHCDIKPENILLSDVDPEQTKFLLGDLGSSQFAARQGWRQDKPAASPAYLAPEVLYEQFDGTADLYSLALVYAELLLGAPLFTGTPQDILQAQLKVMPNLAGVEPVAARDLLHHLLQKQPKARPQTAAAVLDRVSRSLLGRDATVLPNRPQPVAPRVTSDSALARRFGTAKALERLESIHLTGAYEGLWGLNRGRLPMILAERGSHLETHLGLIEGAPLATRDKSTAVPQVISGSRVLFTQDQEVHLWSPPQGKEETLLTLPMRPTVVRCSANERFVLAANVSQTLVTDRQSQRQHRLPWPTYGTGTAYQVFDDGSALRATSVGAPTAELANPEGKVVERWPLSGLLVSASPFAEPAYCFCAGGAGQMMAYVYYRGRWQSKPLPPDRVRAFSYAAPLAVLLLQSGELLLVTPELELLPGGRVSTSTTQIFFSPDNVYCFHVATSNGGGHTHLTTFLNHGS